VRLSNKSGICVVLISFFTLLTKQQENHHKNIAASISDNKNLKVWNPFSKLFYEQNQLALDCVFV
jgi:hypothetical protein